MKKTRLIAVLITVVLAFSCVAAVSARSPMVRWRYGDASADNKITTTDARLILKCCLEEDPNIYATRVDVNWDGEVTTLDARIVLQAVAGIRNYSCVGVYQEWVYPVDADYYLKEPKLTWGTIR